ncbi:PREDICTED: developmental pluripotency-associated protein 4 [Condylura cristata]|uniref:developmental pluripotency-associated protein 4 n=1 Tax=Condylura cristata TaxID=143302 RepID=UPI000643C167|nr:PREDICTED: developmental pluripotency-associated protein 4 [Condylura cristata]
MISAKGTKRKRSVKEDKASCKPEKAQDNDGVKPERKKIPIPPLPLKIPPINLLHRDIVRAWGRELKLSTKGQKLEVYKRICEYAYPNQKDIPNTAKEARILKKSELRALLGSGKITPESSEETNTPKVTASPVDVGPAPVLEASTLEAVDTVLVTTSAQDAVFASWTRITAMAGRMEGIQEVQSPPELSDVRWCVIHGRCLSSEREGWVRLQFHGGQAWVPEKQGQVCALFLLPSCNFPPSHLEDNMLCPKCVQRNRILMKSLQ